MNPNAVSKTAQFMALFRALESRRPLHQRLFSDPLARCYLSPALKCLIAGARLPFVRAALDALIDRRWPGARSSGIARTRLIDDEMKDAIAAGAKQAVILGAGFDARAYRLAELAQIAVFEVDHPATSTVKRKLTQAALGTIPANVSFVQTDFNRQGLKETLEAAGYTSTLRTLFVWEGVSNYLSTEAVDATLSFCASSAAGSCVVFTYIDKKVLERPESFYGTEGIVRLLAGVEERWTFGFEPSHLEAYLGKLGLKLESDLCAAEYRRRYFKEESEAMRGYEFYRVATAGVPKNNEL
jgi:methyltransferase (TIGR00027 family)